MGESMDDLVSRAEVLSILRRYCSQGYRDIDGDWQEGSIDKEAMRVIEAMPGEPPCREQEGEPLTEKQWIPVSECLPDYGQRVLGTFMVTYGPVCRTTERIKLHGNDVWLAGMGDDPIAWMPIPDPWGGD